MRVVKRDLVVDGGGTSLGQIVVRLLDFLGPRAMLGFGQASLGAFPRAARLFVHGAELFVFQADQNLALLDLVAFFHANPRHAARHLGVHADLVMRDDVAAGGEHRAAGRITAFRRRAHDFNFRRAGGEDAIGKRDDSEQDHDRNAADNDAPRPGGRVASASLAQRMVDAQALEVVVFGVYRHSVHRMLTAPLRYKF